MTKVIARGMFLVGLGVLLALSGCKTHNEKPPPAKLPTQDTRGTFGSESCPNRVPVNSNAVVAIYYDAAGNQVGNPKIIEDLWGTTVKNMCETAPPPEPTGGCGALCVVVINGVGYCRKC